MTRLVLPMVAFAVVGFILPRPAQACSCVSITVEEEVQVADIILTGTVTEFTITPPLDPDTPDTLEHTSNVILQVDEYLKESGPSTVTILEPGLTYYFDDDGDVGMAISSCTTFGPASVGSQYLLYLQGEVDSLVSPGVCGSRRINQDDSDYVEDVREAVAAVEALPTTGSAPPSERSGESTPWLPIIGSSLGLTLVASGGWLTLRARRRA